MTTIKEKIRLKYNLKAFNKALEKTIGNIGSYKLEYTNSGIKVVYNIDDSKLREKFRYQSEYKLLLPSIKDLNAISKKFYENYYTGFDDIEYVFENFDFNKNLYIDTFGNVTMKDCSFDKDFMVKNAKNVTLKLNYSKTPINYLGNVFNINAYDLIIKNYYGITFFQKDCNFKFDIKNNIFFEDLKLFAPKSNIDINCLTMIVNNVNIKCKQIKIDANEIIECIKHSCITSDGVVLNIDKYSPHISIHQALKNPKSRKEYDANDLIDKNIINSSSIVYNGVEILNHEMIELQNAREELIKKLRDLRDYCYEDIQKETKVFEKRLKSKSVASRFKNMNNTNN